jgi:hypothetical protein
VHEQENSFSGDLLAASFEKVSEAQRLTARLMREEDSKRSKGRRKRRLNNETTEGLLGSGAF